MKPFFNLLTESDGEGKEAGEPREKRDEFSVHRLSSSLEMILLGFLSLHMLLAHPLVLPRGAFSHDVCANSFFSSR